MKLAVILIGLAICSGPIFSRQARYFRICSRVSRPRAHATSSNANGAVALVDPIILNAAQKHNVQPSLVKGIVAAESQFKPNAISRCGALGLMQLTPKIAQQFGANPLDPTQNIEAGTRYLRVLLDRYSNYRNCLACAIAAYNAGPGMVDRYRGIPPIKETQAYVVRVLSYMRLYEGGRS
jgi:soluble lytic murein transglycosylase-like protein